ncbi:MAG: proton-conducting transporter membrane subunit, partial [Pseudomonadota bacterium]
MLLSFAPTELMLAAIAIPFIGALAIVVCSFHRNVREAATLTTAFSLFWVVISLLPHILDGARPSVTLVEPLAGLGIAFAVEPLGMLFALIASGLWIVNSIYSIGYMRGNNEPRQTLFYLCFAIALGATMGLAFSANLLTLFLCYEILTLSTYPLVTHKMNDNAKEAGRVYLGLLIGTSMVLLLPAILFTWAVAGTVTFTPGGVLPETMTPLAVGMLFALFLFGIGKAAVMPGHAWLPAAMVAPTPVSALLHAVAVVKAGVFTVVKVVVYIFGIETLSSTGQGAWLVPVAGFTIVVASLIALQQSNLKKRLAFSTVSQLSYVVLAAAILTPISAVGAAMHIA